MKWQLILLNILELCACIAGFKYWKKIRYSFWRWFPVFLGIIFLTEVLCEYFLYALADLKTNIAIYSYFGIPFQFFFFYWLFYQQFKTTSISKWPLVLAAIYFCCLLADLFYIDKLEFYFESFSYTIACILLLILLLVYFSRFIQSNAIIGYRTDMMFWVCLGVLIFYVGSMPFFAFRKRLYVEHKDLFYIYWYVQFGLNYLMYLIFIIAFLWGKPK